MRRLTHLSLPSPPIVLPLCRLSCCQGRTLCTSAASHSQHSAPASSPSPRIVFSGIQPTGIPHLGNYLGAVKNWVLLQQQAEGGVLTDRRDSLPPSNMGGGKAASIGNGEGKLSSPKLIYCVVDLHAMTLPYDSKGMTEACRNTAAALLACGLKPTGTDGKNPLILFRQSQVRQHSELCWLLSCITPLGMLSRMTQFKAKSKSGKDSSALGLLSYPVLQAADILLYRATEVPVGEDQYQHLELARDIAQLFNNRYTTPPGYFALPKTVTPPGGGKRIMSLRDASKKMSKSDPDDGSRINLTDTAEEIRDKIRKAKTDSITGFSFDEQGRPEKSNLLTIHSALSGESIDQLVVRHATRSALDYKNELAEVIVSAITPIGVEVKKLLADGSYVDNVLNEGAAHAQAIGEATMREVRELVGSS